MVKKKLLQLDLGCGPNKKPGFVGVDSIKFPGVDVVLDLNKKRWPWATSSVDEVHMSHCIEHFTADQRVHIYNEIHRILKKGAKLSIITPAWSSGRAYGDPTHQWPPVSCFSFLYLNAEWRKTNAPHTDIKHNPKGFSCDFDPTSGFGMHPEVSQRSQDFQQFALTFYIEAAQDIIATLTKK